MQIVVNKDLSIEAVEPESVNQGSANANFLSVFAPFSIANYASVLLYVTLPSGELLEPRAAFATTITSDGVGVWSMPIDAKMTETPGTVYCQLAFVGMDDTVATTDRFAITVNKGVAPFPPATPSYDVYQQILAYLSALSSGAAEGGDGSSVVIVQTKGTSTTAVMSQAAVTNEIARIDNRLILDRDALSEIDKLAVATPTYDSVNKVLTFRTLDGNTVTDIELLLGGNAGGSSEPAVEILSESNPDFIIHDQGNGIYKARVLMLTTVPSCADQLDVYYYCTNMLVTLQENGMTLNRVCLSNNLLHSNESMYNSRFQYSLYIPLPLGDEMTFGYNSSGYYLRPNIIGGDYADGRGWVSDWYVEMELDVNQGVMIIKAYQCSRLSIS